MKTKYEDWHFQPWSLNKDERDNPEKLIEAFFDHWSVPEYREMLRNIFHSTLQKNSSSLLLEMYEFCISVEKLIDAIFIMKRNKDEE